MRMRPSLRLLALVVAQVACARWARPLSGTSERRLVVDGVPRTYLIHAAAGAKPGRALVLVLHGVGGTGAAIEQRTRGTFDRLADREGAVVVYPDAIGGRRWNDGWFSAPGLALPDDLAFLSALVDAAVAELGVDRKRVFAVGFSNGASMVYRLACERPALVAAVAPVSGGMTFDVARGCARGAPVSLIGMHGTDDPVVPFDPSIQDGIAAWSKRDGCPTRPSSSPIADLDPSDGTQTRVDVFGPCVDGTEVAFYTIAGGGHSWPGGDEPLRTFFRRGKTARDFDAAVLIWDFFQEHARR
jgi:polyhydroxybutyrate depolymerase